MAKLLASLLESHGPSSFNVFGEKIEGWDSSCPSWMPGYHTHTHGFCQKLEPPKEHWFAPARPAKRSIPVQAPGGWEPDAQELRQEQQSFSQEPQVPFHAPPQRRPKRHPVAAPPPPPPVPRGALGGAPAPAPRPEGQPARPAAEAETEPRPPLIVKQKTSEAKPPESSVEIFEDEPTLEEQMMPEEAKQLANKLTEEGVQEMEKEEERSQLPHAAPGTPPEPPWWPPVQSAPQVEPLPPRPGEPDYNYGWTPPAQREPYTVPWPGGGPLTTVQRGEAIVAGAAESLQGLVQGAQDFLVNTTM